MSGPPQIQIAPATDGDIQVFCPYHPWFLARAKKFGGRFESQPKPLWRFNARQELRVRALCREIFGTDGTPGEPTVTLLLRAEREITAQRGGVFFAGRMIARAFHRDSGARVGPGVALLNATETDGEPVSSSGTNKYWLTRIRPGAEFELYELPEAALPNAERAAEDGWRFEIIAGTTPVDG